MNRTRAKIGIIARPTHHVEMLADALASGGHSVSVAGDYQAVKRLLDMESCDVLVVDIGSPAVADADTLNRIRTEYPELPVICISSASEPDRPVLNGDILITKPYRISHIEECIHRLLDPAPRPEAHAADEAILVVDDDEVFRTLLARSLRLFGYSVKLAQDGQKAANILEGQSISAVIADIYMPGIDGITLLKNIKRQRPHIPVILITGYHINDEWPMDADVSPDGFLMKPFKIQNINELLENLTKRKPEK